jgi:hypothetical protein
VRVSWGADESLGLCARTLACLHFRGDGSNWAQGIFAIDLDWSGDISQERPESLTFRTVSSGHFMWRKISETQFRDKTLGRIKVSLHLSQWASVWLFKHWILSFWSRMFSILYHRRNYVINEAMPWTIWFRSNVSRVLFLRSTLEIS